SAGSTYDSVKDIDIISFGSIKARNFSHSNFPNPIAPPPLNTTATYGALSTVVSLQVSTDGGTSWSTVQANGPVQVSLFHSSDTGTTSNFDTEMLQLNLSGVGPFGPFMIRESPTLHSVGN